MVYDFSIDNIKKNIEYIGENFNSGDIGFTRLAFSDEENSAIDWLRKKSEKHNFEVHRDSVGNLFARIGPKGAPVTAFGSHLDSVQNGGLFDGALGVVVGLECLIYLKENGFDKENAYELICFRAEEGNPLGGTFGSRVLTGEFNVKDIDSDNLTQHNLSKKEILNSHNTLKNYKSFIELHIEQGTLLEENHNKTGIVTNIAGINRKQITVFGESGHSGTVQMKNRNDALVSASEIVSFVNDQALKLNNGTVATVGQLNVLPNFPTIIPNEVQMTLEIRSGDQKYLDEFMEYILKWIEENFMVQIHQLVEKKANSLSTEVIDLIEKTADELDIDSMKIVSGANHDANSLVNHTEVGMIFVPSIEGISHNPQENSNWKDIEKASILMLNTLKNINDK